MCFHCKIHLVWHYLSIHWSGFFINTTLTLSFHSLLCICWVGRFSGIFLWWRIIWISPFWINLWWNLLLMYLIWLHHRWWWHLQSNLNAVVQISMWVSDCRLVFCTFPMSINYKLVLVYTRLIYFNMKIEFSFINSMHWQLFPFAECTCNKDLITSMAPEKNILTNWLWLWLWRWLLIFDMLIRPWLMHIMLIIRLGLVWNEAWLLGMSSCRIVPWVWNTWFW